jgi:hypothetical protein
VIPPYCDHDQFAAQVRTRVTASGTRKRSLSVINGLLPRDSTFLYMTFIRRRFQGLISIVGSFTTEDANALLCAAGVTNYEIDKLLPRGSGVEDDAVPQDVTVLIALSLEVKSPRLSWKSRGSSPGFLWKTEADLSVRDWIYLL